MLFYPNGCNMTSIGVNCLQQEAAKRHCCHDYSRQFNGLSDGLYDRNIYIRMVEVVRMK